MAKKKIEEVAETVIEVVADIKEALDKVSGVIAKKNPLGCLDPDSIKEPLPGKPE